MAYVTTAEVCGILAWDPDSPDDQNTVDLFIPIAEDMIEQYCGCSFASETGVSKSLNGNGGSNLWARGFLRNVTAVEIYDDLGNPTTDVPTYAAWPDNPLNGLYRGLVGVGGYLFPVGVGNVMVTGDWGFDPTNVPNAFKAAVAFTVKRLASQRDFDENVSKESGGGRYVEFNLQAGAGLYIPAFAKSLLAPYRLSRRFDA